MVPGGWTASGGLIQADAVTDIAYTLRVTDTETGTTRAYENELGQLSESVIDTAAFATCP